MFPAFSSFKPSPTVFNMQNLTAEYSLFDAHLKSENWRVLVQVWSNDKYESAEHRVVVNSERERFSIPFFFDPGHYIDIKPLDDLINKENPAKFKAYNWGNFFTSRKGSNFKKLDVENLQIQHFKISEWFGYWASSILK